MQVMSVLYEILIAAVLSFLFSHNVESPKEDQSKDKIEQVSERCS